MALGAGAASWLTEAAAAGTRRIRAKMADAVALAKLRGLEDVDRALGTAAISGRFAEGDLLAILDHQTSSGPGTEPTRAGEDHSLQPGTSAWATFGLPTSQPTDQHTNTVQPTGEPDDAGAENVQSTESSEQGADQS